MNGWKAVITPDELLSNPRLSLLRSLVEIGRGQLGQAQKEVEQAESLFRLSSDELRDSRMQAPEGPHLPRPGCHTGEFQLPLRRGNQAVYFPL